MKHKVRCFQVKDFEKLEELYKKVGSRLEEFFKEKKDQGMKRKEIMDYEMTMVEIIRTNFTLPEIGILVSCGIEDEKGEDVDISHWDAIKCFEYLEKVMEKNNGFFPLSFTARVVGTSPLFGLPSKTSDSS